MAPRRDLIRGCRAVYPPVRLSGSSDSAVDLSMAIVAASGRPTCEASPPLAAMAVARVFQPVPHDRQIDALGVSVAVPVVIEGALRVAVAVLAVVAGEHNEKPRAVLLDDLRLGGEAVLAVRARLLQMFAPEDFRTAVDWTCHDRGLSM